jgi:hypothetical protein
MGTIGYASVLFPNSNSESPATTLFVFENSRAWTRVVIRTYALSRRRLTLTGTEIGDASYGGSALAAKF